MIVGSIVHTSVVILLLKLSHGQLGFSVSVVTYVDSNPAKKECHHLLASLWKTPAEVYFGISRSKRGRSILFEVG